MRRALIPALVLLVFATIRCSEIPPDPLQLNRSMLTVDNRTKDDWTGVEIWLNQYFRINATPAMSSIAPIIFPAEISRTATPIQPN